jgi:tetratricopeptide (TPR) repeat protein
MTDARPHTCRRRLAAVVALTALLVALPAPRAASAATAPLDTFEVAPVPVAEASMDISRRVLPDVSTTVVPRVAAPAVPPRLDDPAAGEQLFRRARLAAGAGPDAVSGLMDAAVAARPADSRLPLWLVMESLRAHDLGAVVWHLPTAWRAVLADPLAAPRLAAQGHQAGLLGLAVLWTVLVAAGYAAWWRPLAHDLGALMFRDPDHRLRPALPLLLLAVAILLRPGWLGGLAVLSIPLLLQARGRARALLLTVWMSALVLTAPVWPALRQAAPVLDPASETTLLARAGRDAAAPALMRQLREGLAVADDPDRAARLRLALGIQEARRGRYGASDEQFARVLSRRPDDVTALVGRANNAYYTSRFDDALAGYHRARGLAPDRGEIPYNQAQVYFRKLFVPEAGQALDDARALGFDPVGDSPVGPDAARFSPVAYLGLSRGDLRAAADAESGAYPPLAHLAAWNYFLGAPPLPLAAVLAGLLAVAVALIFGARGREEIRRCASCRTEICGGCAADHQGHHLCRHCGETAARSRSDMVLATLLKNRARTEGLATTARLAVLARLVPGAAHLALGQVGTALGRLLLLAVALWLLTCGWAFDPAATWTSPGLSLAEETVDPLWLPLPVAAWPGAAAWPMTLGWALLALTYTLAIIDGARLRQTLPERLVQQHGGPAADSGGA